MNEDIEPSHARQFTYWQEGEMKIYLQLQELLPLLYVMSTELCSVVEDLDRPINTVFHVSHHRPPYKDFKKDLRIIYNGFKKVDDVRKRMKQALSYGHKMAKWAGDQGYDRKVLPLHFVKRYLKPLEPAEAS
jgi:hypothetical protein